MFSSYRSVRRPLGAMGRRLPRLAPGAAPGVGDQNSRSATPLSLACVVAQAFPARSVIDAVGPHETVPVPAKVDVAPPAVPRVIVMVEPLIAIVDPVKETSAAT